MDCQEDVAWLEIEVQMDLHLCKVCKVPKDQMVHLYFKDLMEILISKDFRDLKELRDLHPVKDLKAHSLFKEHEVSKDLMDQLEKVEIEDSLEHSLHKELQVEMDYKVLMVLFKDFLVVHLLRGRRAPRQVAAASPGDRAADRDVRVPKSHRSQLSEHRPTVRRPRPHHGDPRCREDPASDG